MLRAWGKGLDSAVGGEAEPGLLHYDLIPWQIPLITFGTACNLLIPNFLLTTCRELPALTSQGCGEDSFVSDGKVL